MKNILMLIIFLFVYTTSFADTNFGGSFFIKENEKHKVFYSFGGTGIINGEVEKLFVFGSTITINGSVKEMYTFGGKVNNFGKETIHIMNFGSKIVGYSNINSKNNSGKKNFSNNFDIKKNFQVNFVFRFFVLCFNLLYLFLSIIIYFIFSDNILKMQDQIKYNFGSSIIKGLKVMAIMILIAAVLFSSIFLVIGALLFPLYVLFLGFITILVSPLLNKLIGDFIFTFFNSGLRMNPYYSIILGALVLAILQVIFPASMLIMLLWINLFFAGFLMVTKFGTKNI